MHTLVAKLKAIGKLVGAVVVAGALMSLAILPFAGAAGWTITASSNTMNSNLQDIGNNSSLRLLSTMTDKDGKAIAYFYDQYRIPVESNEISQNVKDSIVAIEDRRFYEHSGVDLRGTLRAMVSNVSSGGVSEGASTLDQQYVKNYLYYIAAQDDDQAQSAVETSIPRKLREMKMASEVDKNYSKDEILTRYLNLISFGNSAYGIEAAARTYFGVHASELNVPQSAFLAGVVQSTAGLDPYTYPEAALERRNEVLQARVEMGTLSQEEADAYKQEPLGVKDSPSTPSRGCIGAGDNGFFCDYALQWLDQHGLSEEEVLKGGYTIKTTLDATAQAEAVKQARAQVDSKADGVASVSSFITPVSSEKNTQNVQKKAAEQAAEEDKKAQEEGQKKLKSAKNDQERQQIQKQLDDEAKQRQHERDVKSAWSTSTSHQVLAMASSRVYGLDADNKETVLPLTHSLQGNGAGSVFKIFDAAAALERGAGLDTMLNVPKRVEVSGMGDGGASGCPSGMYCVENSADYKPQMTLRDALATSPNTPFIEMAQTVGMERIVDLSVDLGLRSYAEKGSFSADMPDVSMAEQMKKDNNASYVLGPTAVNPLELSNVAATLADGGRWCEPKPITSVTDRDGNAVKLKSTDCEQVIQKEVADALANALGNDVVNGSGEEAAKATGWSGQVSAKTGTTESNMSAAFFGFGPKWAGSTYVFNDGSTTTPLCTSPARQCSNGDMYGGKEAARTFLATSRSQIGRFGGASLPGFDQRYLAGRDPNGYADAYNHRNENRPSQSAPSLIPAL